jgi:hypothetical protein
MEWVMKSRTGFVLLVTLLASFHLAAAAVVHDYAFDRPAVETIGGEHWITMKGCRTGGVPGSPALPSYGVKLLLPPGEGIQSLRVIPEERELLGTGFTLPPNQVQVPYSFTGVYEPILPDPAIYETDRAYPYELHSSPFTQGYCGRTIAFVTINPVTYNPVTGEVGWYRRLRVEVETAPESNATLRLRTLYQTNERVQKNLQRWVDNVEMTELYPAVDRDRDEEWDLVIITNEALEPSFQVLADFKNRRGTRTRIETTEWIYDNYTGSDSQDKIRNYIIDCYTDWGIQYVLLGGDGDANGGGRIIPHRGVYVETHYGGYPTTDYGLPCDLYYGGLDGNWNADGDGQYGEETPEEADFIAEVHVGRACVDSPTEANNFVNKHIMYEQSPVIGDCDDVLFAGELLWNDVPGVWTFGRTYMEEVRWGSSNHGYTTVGIDNPWVADTLYDQFTYYPGEWSAMSHIRPKLNNGCNFLNHLGHCWSDYMVRFYNSDITDANMTNDGINHNFYVVYSQGCYPGSFEVNDCIAEIWTCGIAHGAVAAVANTRYGWGFHQSTRGSSQYFHREFVDAMYGEDLTNIASANDDSKVDCLPWILADDMANRWCALEITVFGDPELDIWTAQPVALSPSYDPIYVIGTGTFEVDVPGIEGALVACNYEGELVGRGLTDPTGHVAITLDPAPMVPGNMEIVVTAHNHLEHSGSVLAILPSGPYLLYESLTINDLSGNDNGLLDFAEDVKLSIAVENVGLDVASGVLVSISTDDDYVTVHDDTADYGDIPSESIKTIADGFEIEVDASVPDLHVIPFIFTATDGDSTWFDDFSIVAHAPELTIHHIVVVDGDNGRLDPDETADLQIHLLNAGSAELSDIEGTLSCSDPYITLNSTVDNLATIPPGEMGVVTYNVTTDSETPIGHPAEFQLDVAAANYSFADNFFLSIGLCIEDFEIGNFASYPWEMGGSSPWGITASGAYEGNYCAQSGLVSELQYSEMSVNLDVVTDGTITFYYKVSSEGDDYLRFYVDGALQGQWSGETGWAQAAFLVTTGNRTFTWIYMKDLYGSSGNDCAWVDFIVFPQVETPPGLPPVAFCYDFETDQGWTAGAAGDDATYGIWERANPEGTTFQGYLVQPEDDHTSDPGENCWVTDGRAGAGAGSYDVDDGTTTLLSPVWDLSDYLNAVIQLWTWYSNDEGPSPGTDYLVVDVSSDGGASWVNLLSTRDDWEFWRKSRYTLEDHITLTSEVQLRVVASDEDEDSFIEAAVDDVCLYGLTTHPLPPSDLVMLTEGSDIHLFWEPSAGATGYRIERAVALDETYEVVGNVGAEILDWVHVGGAETDSMAFYRIIATQQ